MPKTATPAPELFPPSFSSFFKKKKKEKGGGGSGEGRERKRKGKRKGKNKKNTGVLVKIIFSQFEFFFIP